jgi:hypothetical protein
MSENEPIEEKVEQAQQELKPQTEQQAAAIADARTRIESAMKSGGSWFYWIAGLSMVNSVLALLKANLVFVVGLGVSQVIDAFGQVMGNVGMMIALVLNVIIAAIFIMFGFFANKGHKWSFIVGMVLYVFDALILLAFKEIMSVGFHIFALYCMYKGLSALTTLKKLDSQAPIPTAGQ